MLAAGFPFASGLFAQTGVVVVVEKGGARQRKRRGRRREENQHYCPTEGEKNVDEAEEAGR